MNKKNIKRQDVIGAAVFVLICEAAGGIGAIFTTPQIATWYTSLAKPAFNPPNWIFGPVWTLLFALMGIAAYLVWKKRAVDRRVEQALMIFFVQLGLNILWSVLFFGTQSPENAFAEIIILWLAVLATIFSFKPISKNAMYLLLPYILWISFAAYLNFSILWLN